MYSFDFDASFSLNPVFNLYLSSVAVFAPPPTQSPASHAVQLQVNCFTQVHLNTENKGGPPQPEKFYVLTY